MKFCLILFALLLCSSGNGQSNYSGNYGFSESHAQLVKRHPEAKKDETGYQNNLVLVRLNDQQYKFWLYVIRGYPGYNSGHQEGLISLTANTGTYFENDTVDGTICKLLFRFDTTSVVIEQVDGDCAFGANVIASGRYPKNGPKNPTTLDIVNTYQTSISQSTVVSDKATIYDTSDDSKPTTKYFIKNDKVYTFYEEAGFVFFQLITKNGKYMEGWLKQTDLK